MSWFYRLVAVRAMILPMTANAGYTVQNDVGTTTVSTASVDDSTQCRRREAC
jgi:hypothetical protein